MSAPPTPMYNVASHYNRKLHECVALVQSRAPRNGEEFGILGFLFFVKEDREVAEVLVEEPDHIARCYVMEAQCTSLSEWDQLTKPYMKE